MQKNGSGLQVGQFHSCVSDTRSIRDVHRSVAERRPNGPDFVALLRLCSQVKDARPELQLNSSEYDSRFVDPLSGAGMLEPWRFETQVHREPSV
jgi:hypothetical protein